MARINLDADGNKYVNGLILLPDNWQIPASVTFKSGFASANGVQEYADYQTITLVDWQTLESAGAVFLPEAGDYNGTGVCQSYKYWSATGFVDYDFYIGENVNYAYVLSISSNFLSIVNFTRNCRCAVRLVQDVK